MWHPVSPVCPHCNIHTKTTCVTFNALGFVAVEGYCERCDLYMYIQFTFADAVQKCEEMDNPSSPEYSLVNFQPKGRPN